MKKFFLLSAFLLFALTSFSQNVFSLFGKANTFFDLFAAGKFEEAHAYFSEEGKTKVTAENLKQFWATMEGRMGKVKSIDATGSKNQGEFYAVNVSGEFQYDKQDFILLFDKTEKLVGLHLPPKAITYRAPGYADSTLYKEKSTYIEWPGHQLAAIVTTPKDGNSFPIVVLVHGSGPNDMDETLGPNKPFKDIAAGLAVNGIASIRYVKRTVIYPQEFGKAYTVKEEVLDDVLQAIALAKKVEGVDLKQIYVLGHSLGGMLAPRIATMAPDLKGIILAAAPARSLSDIIIEQNKYMVEQSKDTTVAMQKNLANAIIEIEKTKITKLGKMKPDSILLGLPASYWVDLNSYDQVAIAKKLKQRIFVIQGGYDFQVSETDFNIWNEALSGNKNVTLKLYPEYNHLFSQQEAKGNMMQYQKPGNVEQRVIEDLSAWIKEL
ncbi:Alpha/beta hydrolase family protein [compost metagenome]